MRLEYYAHSCFCLTTPHLKVILDPYSEETGYRLPLRPAHYTLISHNHFDHNHTAAVRGRTTVVRGASPREFDFLKLRGLLAEHGGGHGQVTCFILELDGLTVCHLSDLGVPLTAEQARQIGPIDVLMVPTGGGDYTLAPRQAQQAIELLKPRWAFPMHFRTPFLNRERFPDLEPVDSFLRIGGRVQKLRESSVELAPGTAGPTEIMALPHMF